MKATVIIHESAQSQTGEGESTSGQEGSKAGNGGLQVRDAVFETNSSSSHSLTVGSSDSLAGTFPKEMLRAGKVPVRVGEFGWEYRRYFEPINKVRYLVTQITDGEPPQVGGEDEVTAHLVKENQDFRLLAEVVKAQSGCDLVVEPGSGYIDHQSARGEKGVGMELFESADQLRHFIFSPDSFIQTGNDNSPAGWTIQTDKGEQLAYEHRFAEPGEGWVPVKFIRMKASLSDLATGAGGLVSEEACKTLWAEVIRTGVVMSVEWIIGDPYSFERNATMDQTRGKAAAELSFGRHPMRISRDLRVFRELHESKDREEDFSFVTMVPADLGARLSALDSKGHRQYLVKEAERWVSYWKERLKESPTDRWALERVAEAERKLRKLIGARAMAAWLKKEAAGRGKESFGRSNKDPSEKPGKKLVKPAKQRAAAVKGASK